MSGFSPQGTVLTQNLIASHPSPSFASCASLAIAHFLLLAQEGDLKVLKQYIPKSDREHCISHCLPAMILGVVPKHLTHPSLAIGDFSSSDELISFCSLSSLEELDLKVRTTSEAVVPDLTTLPADSLSNLKKFSYYEQLEGLESDGQLFVMRAT